MKERSKFELWYKSFLLEAGCKSIEEAIADKEADRVSSIVDTEALEKAAESEYCMLCADDGDVRRADCYGLTDLGNNQPTEKRDVKIGGSATGTVLPVTLAACKRCRKNFMLVQLLPTLLSTAIILCTLILVNLPGVKQHIYAGNLFIPATMRPFFIFAVVTAISILLCAGLRRLLIEKLSIKTTFNVLDIKSLHFLREGGWFRLYSNKHFSQVLFSDEKPSYIRIHDEYMHDENCDCLYNETAFDDDKTEKVEVQRDTDEVTDEKDNNDAE